MKPLAFSIAAALVLQLASSPSAWAADVRPQGYLERGQMMNTEDGYMFVSDSESGRMGGRFFRLSGSDVGVFYGLGSHPSIDWLWPTHRVYPSLRDIIEASPGGLSSLRRYEDGAEYTQGFARAGWMLLMAGVGAALGGLAYNLVPGNTREMQPVYFGVSGGVALVGLIAFTGAQMSAVSNEALLNQAIESYNREMAGRRRRGPAPMPTPSY